MFNEDLVPEQLLKRARTLNRLASSLEKQIKNIQENCEHKTKIPIKKFDPNYSPRIDGGHKGMEVVVSLKCAECKLVTPITELPFKVCYKCGSEMKHDRNDRCGEDKVFVHKCVSCGHEYDTT